MTPLTKAQEILRSALISPQPLTLSVTTYYLGACSTHLALLTVHYVGFSLISQIVSKLYQYLASTLLK